MNGQVLLNPKAKGTTVVATIEGPEDARTVALVRFSVRFTTTDSAFRLHGPEIEGLRVALNAWAEEDARKAEQDAHKAAELAAGKACPDRPCPVITARYCHDRACPSVTTPTVTPGRVAL